MKVNGLVCGAWLSTPAGDLSCVLAAGHYTGPRPGAAVGESRHTNCLGALGAESRDMAVTSSHDHSRCTVWIDSADGAHPSDVTVTTCVRCPHPPALHRGPDGCRVCDCELAESESTDEGWAQPVTPAGTGETNRSGRTLAGVIQDYEATTRIGGAHVRVKGPARLVAYVIRSFADAFEEESER